MQVPGSIIKSPEQVASETPKHTLNQLDVGEIGYVGVDQAWINKAGLMRVLSQARLLAPDAPGPKVALRYELADTWRGQYDLRAHEASGYKSFTADLSGILNHQWVPTDDYPQGSCVSVASFAEFNAPAAIPSEIPAEESAESTEQARAETEPAKAPPA